MSARAKFIVEKVEDAAGYNGPGKNIHLRVIGAEGEPHVYDENKSFF